MTGFNTNRNTAGSHAEVDAPKGNELLDATHLSRQTMGDKVLEREILLLFVVQCEACIKALQTPATRGQLFDTAHQMKGCAKSVGAWNLAKAATLLEENPADCMIVEELLGCCVKAKKLARARC